MKKGKGGIKKETEKIEKKSARKELLWEREKRREWHSERGGKWSDIDHEKNGNRKEKKRGSD